MTLPFSLVSHTIDDVLTLSFDPTEMLRDEEGNHSLVCYPWYSVVVTNYLLPPSTKVKTGLSVIEFLLTDTKECNHCLGLHSHPFGECTHFRACKLCWNIPSMNIHKHIIDECQFFQQLKERDLYHLPTIPRITIFKTPKFNPQSSTTILGRMAKVDEKEPIDLKKKKNSRASKHQKNMAKKAQKRREDKRKQSKVAFDEKMAQLKKKQKN